uniref:Uncharacterized protein n=1 Tax=Thermogemmatispora argillosa TaxID=2045280 RepID=A0A455T413_9CHLR|nr:hypothetical protein KTA_27590 [Thermogemmatispora argillosa]
MPLTVAVALAVADFPGAGEEGVDVGITAEPVLPQALNMSKQRSNAERILECSLRSIACPSRKPRYVINC